MFSINNKQWKHTVAILLSDKIDFSTRKALIEINRGISSQLKDQFIRETLQS